MTRPSQRPRKPRSPGMPLKMALQQPCVIGGYCLFPLVSRSQTASSPPFLYTDVIGLVNTLYRFCAEPPELGGSLLCSYHGDNGIHSDKPRYTDRNCSFRCEGLPASTDGTLLFLSGRFKQLCEQKEEEASTQRCVC